MLIIIYRCKNSRTKSPLSGEMIRNNNLYINQYKDIQEIGRNRSVSVKNNSNQASFKRPLCHKYTHYDDKMLIIHYFFGLTFCHFSPIRERRGEKACAFQPYPASFSDMYPPFFFHFRRKSEKDRRRLRQEGQESRNSLLRNSGNSPATLCRRGQKGVKKGLFIARKSPRWNKKGVQNRNAHCRQTSRKAYRGKGETVTTGDTNCQ